MSVSSRSTTCIQGRKFEVRQACGAVTDEYGAPIPDAKIEVVPTVPPNDARETSPDQNGRFTFSMVPDGEYDI